MSTVSPGTVQIPQECSSEQLFREASEVLQLSTDLARLEDQFERKYFEFYLNAPVGSSDKGREMYALNCLKDQHNDLWVEIDTSRARMKGLALKARIVESAIRVSTIEHGVGTHSPSN